MYNLFALQIFHKLLDCIKLFPFKNNNLLSPKSELKNVNFLLDVHSPLLFCKFVRIERFKGSHLGLICHKSTGIGAYNCLISTILQNNKGQSYFLQTVSIHNQEKRL